MSDESKALLRKAMTLLIDSYDLEEDCFFVVVTKDGKNPAVDVRDQRIIGELNLKTLVAFMVRAIYQICGAIDMSPHVFISRYLIGAILNEEREGFIGLDMDFEDDYGYPEDDLEYEGEDDEEDFVNFILKTHWTEIEN